jgi:hypothetical protein
MQTVTGRPHNGAVEAMSLRFAGAVERLGDGGRRRGLVVPAFRSPPRLAGCERSIRWRADGGATVAVRLRGRPWVAVLADMVEGVVVANGLDGPAADQARTALWVAVTDEGLASTPSARVA